MKKHTTGFIPASRIQYAFFQKLLDALKEQTIDAMVDQAYDAMQAGMQDVLLASKAVIKIARTKKLVYTGTIDGFIIKHFKGEYQVKKDPRIVYSNDDPYDWNDKKFMFTYHVLRAHDMPSDDMAESFTNQEIHYTIKLPKGVSRAMVQADLDEYNASRRNTTEYDCSGCECGFAKMLPQHKPNEVSIINYVQYDY